MENLTILSIQISTLFGKSESKNIFHWKHHNKKKIAIFYYGNECGKSTLFNIIFDLISNSKIHGEALFTDDLLAEGLEVTMEFSIANCLFRIKKEYISGDVKIFFNNGIDKEVELNSTEYEKRFIEILGIPEDLALSKSKKITLNSILRLHFIDDEHYKKIGQSKKSMCSLANDKYELIGTPLFYYYIFNAYKSTEDLKDAFDIGSRYKLLEKRKEDYSKLLKIKQSVLMDEEKNTQIGLFSTAEMIKEGDSAERDLSRKKIQIYNYNKAVKIIDELLSDLFKLNTLKSEENLSIWYKELSQDKKSLQDRIKILSDKEIPRLTLELKRIKRNEKNMSEFKMQQIETNFESFKHVIKLNKTDYVDLQKEFEKLYEEFMSEKKTFESIIEDFSQSAILDNFNEVLSTLLPKGLNAIFSPEHGRIEVNTFSDSKNRIARFLTLTAFLFLKETRFNINHLGMLISDSPFIGSSSDNISEALSNVFTEYQSKKLNLQMIIFLNKDNEDEYEDLFARFKNLLSIKQGDGMLFDTD